MPYPRVCEECGNEFVPDYKDHTYCSSECAKGEPNMNTAKHTPGPWHLSECATQTTRAGIVSVDGLHITDVNGYGMTDSQNQANATLLAAAPAMYEALQQAQELLRSLVAEEMIHTTELQRVGNCQATMWQALAQAEGK